MRQVLSISLPPTEIRAMKQMARKRGYPSVSGFIHALVQNETELISDTELMHTVGEARKEYRLGKSVKAKSMADLL